jgi:hypothetical protein
MRLPSLSLLAGSGETVRLTLFRTGFTGLLLVPASPPLKYFNQIFFVHVFWRAFKKNLTLIKIMVFFNYCEKIREDETIGMLTALLYRLDLD